MAYDQISALLDRFWDGETTIEEERLLKAYFRSGDVDPRLRKEMAFFGALGAEKDIAHQAELVQMQPLRVHTNNRARYWAVAASAAVVIGACVWMIQPRNNGADLAAQQQVMPAPATATPAATENTLTATPETTNQPTLPPTHRKPGVKTPPKPQQPEIHPPAPQPEMSEAEIAEAELAKAELKAALELLSSKLNKGRKGAARGLEKMDEVDRVIETL